MIKANNINMVYSNSIEKKHDNFIKSLLFIGPLFFLFIISFFSINSKGILGYADEIIAVYYFGYILLNIIICNNVKLLKWLSLFVVFIIIGLLGNVLVNISQLNSYWILLDVFIFLKPYIYILASITYFKRNYSKHFVRLIASVAKLFIIIVFIGALVHCLNYNFNYKSIWIYYRYTFTTPHCFTLSQFLVCFIVCILLSDTKYKKIYFILGFISVLVTTSGVGIMSYFLIFVFDFLFKKIKLQWYHLTVFAALAIVIGWNEISDYLLNAYAPRSIMYKYAFITANNYFPVGCGFGNYGGYSAAYNYSFLYQLYGFNNMWGMSQADARSGSTFVFDTYYPMIIGQFGYIGLVVFLSVLAFIFIKLFKNKKYLTVALMLSIIVLAIGCSISNPAECLIFAIEGLVYAAESNKLKRNQ